MCTIRKFTHTRTSDTYAFLFIRTPPPPISTLFPYTTLFRSHTPEEIGVEDFQAGRAPDKRYRTPPLKGLWTHTKGDRKSTRLNSSHSQISYAVFCLKKKKNIQ